jgi:hypothetical protein
MLRVGRERSNDAEANGPAEQPGSDVQQLDLVAGHKANLLQVGIARREEVQVRNIAETEQPRAELGITDGMQALPAEHAFPPAV